MKIVAFKRLNPYHISGASNNRFRSLIESLATQGADIHIYIMGGYQSDNEMSQYGKKGKFCEGISYTYLSTQKNTNIWQRRLNAYLLKYFRQSFINRKVATVIKKSGKAIFWITDDMDLQIAINKIPKHPDYIYFTEISEFLDIHMAHKGNFAQRALANKSQELFENQTYLKLDALALMTKTLYNHYAQNFISGPELLHLPMTVDLGRFKDKEYPNNQKLKTPYIVFVGVMCNVKDGVDILIDAFSSIATDYKNLNLYFFGPWHYDLPGHIEQIKKLKLEDRVFYKGLIDRDEIPNVLMNAEFLLLPRPDSKQAQGGFPTKLGEYLASGKPVCATKVGELPDYLIDNESIYFSTPGDIDSFRDSMVRLLNDRPKSITIGKKGREVAFKNFNADLQGKQLFSFLNNIWNQKAQ